MAELPAINPPPTTGAATAAMQPLKSGVMARQASDVSTMGRMGAGYPFGSTQYAVGAEMSSGRAIVSRHVALQTYGGSQDRSAPEERMRPVTREQVARSRPLMLQKAQGTMIFSHLHNCVQCSIQTLPFRHPLPRLSSPAFWSGFFLAPTSAPPT